MSDESKYGGRDMESFFKTLATSDGVWKWVQDTASGGYVEGDDYVAEYLARAVRVYEAWNYWEGVRTGVIPLRWDGQAWTVKLTRALREAEEDK